MRGLLGAIIISILVLPVLRPIATSNINLEYSVVRITVSSVILGSPMVLPIPFNTSWVPYENNIYVLSESSPVHYHVLSVNPPVVLVFEPSLTERSYRIFASTENPYASYRVPYTSDVFAVYDDFDVDMAQWMKKGYVSIGGGIARLEGSSWIAMNASVPEDLAAFVSVRGGRGLKIEFQSPGEHLIVLSRENLTDWDTFAGRIQLLNERGDPVTCETLYYDPQGLLIIYVNTPDKTVFLVAGTPTQQR